MNRWLSRLASETLALLLVFSNSREVNMAALACRINYDFKGLPSVSRYLTLLAAFAICASSLAKDKENAEVKFTSHTELVLIPTLVTDKAGAHISGLKKEDFTGLENGSVRQICRCQESGGSHQFV